MKSRVVFCDSRNNKLLWAQLLKHAEEVPAPRPRWWKLALAFLDQVWP
jgi:hypothetical protein